MNFKGFRDFCASCCGKEQPSPKIRKRKLSYTGSTEEHFVVHQFCASAFLPEYARNILQDMKNKKLETPQSVRLHVIFLTCETPAIPDIIDKYTLSNNFSIVDVMDEFKFHVSGIMKSLIMSGGDVIHFQDGFVECIWPIKGDAVNCKYDKALKTALTVQKEFGATQTKLGIKMTNKIGIAVGTVDVLLTGSKRLYYTVVGDVMKEARDSLALSCNSREVLVTTDFWQNIEDKEEYRYKQCDENYLLVFLTKEPLEEPDVAVYNELEERLTCCDKRLEDYVDKYIHPLQKDAKTDQQLQILTTMSQIVFVAVRIKELDLSAINVLHRVVDLVHAIVQEFKGILSKLVYKTDLTICIVFGFPGFKHKDDAARSILCAQKILKSLHEENGVKVAIGISAGMVFCGVLGPTIRLDCSVLGQAVRTALRMVDQFPEKELLCCINTFFRSCRILGEIFTPLKVRVRGTKTLGLLFQVHASEDKKKIPPVKCVGRKKEKEMIYNALKQLKGGMDALENLLPLINITGKLGTGKSTLLSWAMQEGKKLGYKLTARVKNIAFEEPSGNAWSILKQILSARRIDTDSKILETLGSDASQYPLHLLNKRLNTSFPEPAITLCEENAREMLSDLIKKCAEGEPVLIGMENAEHTGTESWLFLQCLLVDRAAVVITTLTEEFSTSIPFVRHLRAQQYLDVQLGPIEDSDLGSLACQVLHVKAIHKGFLDFLQKQSEGNALKLQEILMLPPLQKHFCLTSYNSIAKKRLQQDFVMAEGDDDIDSSMAKVCDILDLENLWSIQIPKHLLDIVKDHTTGLNPEEQMLMRKCSLFGESFGLRILETVCPEYTHDELYEQVKSLADKNILTSACDHWIVDESRDSRKLTLAVASIDYCIHPVRFASDFLKRCVLHSMPDTQCERLHRYLAELLLAERRRSCDACRRQVSKYKIPKMDFRLCHCQNLLTDILIQVEYHLEKGQAPLTKRIDVLLDAAEAGLEARNISKVEELLNKCKRLKNRYDEEKSEEYENYAYDYVRVAIERLRGKVKIYLGKRNDALRSLKQAMLLMNIVFPVEIKSGAYSGRRNEGQLGIEECRCLSLGCFILLTLGKYQDAFRVAKVNVKNLLQVDKGICDLIEARVLLLKAISKTTPGRIKEGKIRKLINQIHQQCFKRLVETPPLEIIELKIIIRAFKTLIRVLFERAELKAANEIGNKSFQLLKIVNYPKQLVRVLFMLTNIAFYEEHYRKCLELICQLQDASQQSGDTISEVIYYTTLAKVLMEERVPGNWEDQKEMCDEYAIRCSVTIPCHPKHMNKLYCVSSIMALWCVERRLQISFVIWYDQALLLQKEVQPNNYWSVSGTIYLRLTEISRVQRKFYVFTSREISVFKQKMNKSLEEIQKQVKNFFPILQRDVKDMEAKLQDTLQECKVLND